MFGFGFGMLRGFWTGKGIIPVGMKTAAATAVVTSLVSIAPQYIRRNYRDQMDSRNSRILLSAGTFWADGAALGSIAAVYPYAFLPYAFMHASTSFGAFYQLPGRW